MWDKAENEVPASEFARRIEQVRRFAHDRGLGAVVAYSAPTIHQWTQSGHVGYLSGWSNLDRIVDTMVVVPRDGEAVLLVSGVEYMRPQIEEVSWLTDVRLVSSPDPRAVSGAYDADVGGEVGAKTFGAEIARILDGCGCRGKPIAVSGAEAMPAPLHRDVAWAVNGQIAAVPDIVARLRQIKSSGEISIMRQVAALSDRCYETMLHVLGKGMWGYELTAEMDRTAKRAGADLVYHCMHTAPDGDLAAGKLSIKAHDCRLRPGDYINVNAYVVYKGYWIQSDRAGTIGPRLGATAAAVVEANFQVQDTVLTSIRPGLAIGELIRIGNESAERLGYAIQGGRIGHGQGLDYSEGPFLIAGSAQQFERGHVFVLHVCLAVPGTDFLINPIADLCLVTKDGCEVLNHFERGLFHVEDAS